MSPPQSFRTRINPRARVAIIGGAVAALMALAIGAVLMSSAYVARQIVDETILLDEAELAIAANDLAVKSLSQAVLLKEDEIMAVADTATAQAATDEALRRVDDLRMRGQELLAVLPGDSVPLETSMNATISLASAVLDALDAGLIAQAGDQLLKGLSDFEALRDELSDVRNTTRSNIEASRGLVGKSGSVVAFLIALLIPIVAILVYRQLATQQVRVAEVELDARIEAEQEIARSKDEFIGNISHELRTPLTSIFGFSELLLRQGLVDPESSLELIALINHEADELARMVEDILTIARADGQTLSYQFGSYDVRAEMDDVQRSLANRGTEIGLAGPHVDGWFDRTRVRQILRNLVSNAVRHGGPTIEVSCEKQGANVEVVIADDGRGVDPEDELRLFSEFFHQGDTPLTKGSLGMGLAVVRVLTQGMHGSVRYERVDGWTRFVVTLPSAEGVAAPGTDGGDIVDIVAPQRNATLGTQIAAAQALEERPGIGAS